MKLSALISLGLVALPELASAAGGFGATCKSKDGTWMRTRQDMNLCMGRDGERIVRKDKGNLFVPSNTETSCAGVSMRGTALRLTCRIFSEKGNREEHRLVDLDYIVGNQDGYMWCSGHRSAPH
ncbi:hypothetical protein QBC42DRAFT_288774 [Cladorrhinum samala]|uniref:Cyanovirin-N domain-containing protein n=1 Tax=Cladorrhinum samala TaxID=585594 RepID=A0AAV9HH48_9PEZI|nr:hypothetical protein QBC42DRAFT_288774 [Cladorrhinum samala]